MILYDFRGRFVEVRRDDFYTETDYYIAILSTKYGTKLQKDNMSVDDICRMI